MASSSPSPLPKLEPEETTTPPQKKTQPLPWTHDETVNLIEVYQDKWYSLKRGQLKASQWEEVALAVAARCGYTPDEPSTKSATQCRHKMEKLRKRYRADKQKLTASVWPYFHLMDHMERGPFPISVRPISVRPIPTPQPPPPPQTMTYDDDDDDDDDDEDEDDDDEDVPPPIFDNSASRKRGREGVAKFWRIQRRREEEEEEDEEEEEGIGGAEAMSKLAKVIRTFSEGFVRVENMKLEMMKESERYRMQMETKRMEMILESQRRTVDAISRAIVSQRKNNNQETRSHKRQTSQ